MNAMRHIWLVAAKAAIVIWALLMPAVISAQTQTTLSSGRVTQTYEAREQGKDIDLAMDWAFVLDNPSVASPNIVLDYQLHARYPGNRLMIDGAPYGPGDTEHFDQVSAARFEIVITFRAGGMQWDMRYDGVIPRDENTFDAGSLSGTFGTYFADDDYFCEGSCPSSEEVEAVIEDGGRAEVVGFRVNEIGTWWYLTSAQTDVERRAREEREAAQAAESDGGGAGGVTRPRATTPTRRPTPERTQPPPAPESTYDFQNDWDSYMEETARIQSMEDSLTNTMEQTFDAIRSWQQSQARQRRWEAAASLDTAGQSPEQMIAQVEQKQRELERLAEQRREEHSREMEELRLEAERTLEEAETEEEAIAGAIGSLGAIAGDVAGSISIERQRQRAEEELDRQLTEAFREIEQDINRDIDESVDTAKQGKAQTLFPEQFEYFVDVIAYYDEYERQVDAGFSIDNTDWMYPPGNRPREPRLARRPRYTSSSITNLMAAKWGMLEANEPYTDETRESLGFLAAVGIEEFPRRPEPYYYRALLTDDVVDRYLLSRQADDLSRDRRYSQQAREDRARLSDSFFRALRDNRRSLIRRVWEIGLATEFQHASGAGAFLFALRENTSSLDYLLRLQPAGQRASVAQSLVLVAASEGEVDGVDVLIDRGADPNARNRSTGATPMLAAASEGQAGVISLLDREHGVNPRNALDDAHEREFVAARYHLARYLLGVAVARNRPQLMGNALAYDVGVVNTEYRDQTSFLGFAAANDRRRFLEAVFESGASPNATDPRGIEIVGVAIEGDADDQTLRLLVEAGASLAATDSEGRTLLHWAAMRPRPELVPYLLERGAPLLQADDRGRVPLHNAVVGLGDALFEEVLSGTGTVDISDDNGETPIHRAITENRPARVQRMLAMAQMIDLQNDNGEGYLHLAVAQAPELVEPLLSRDPAVDIADRAGDTPLHYAVEHERDRETFLLLSAGADVTAQNDNTRTPVHTAIEAGHPLWPSMIRDGSVLNVPDGEGNTPLHLLLARDWRAAEGIVRSHEPAVERANSDGETYLHLAARNGDRLTVEALTGLGAPTDAVDARGNTALHEAARSGSLETTMVLLRAGADPSIRNEDGDRPEHIAGNNEYADTARLLRQWRRRPRYFSRALRDTAAEGGR